MPRDCAESRRRILSTTFWRPKETGWRTMSRELLEESHISIAKTQHCYSPGVKSLTRRRKYCTCTLTIPPWCSGPSTDSTPRSHGASNVAEESRVHPARLFHRQTPSEATRPGQVRTGIEPPNDPPSGQETTYCTP